MTDRAFYRNRFGILFELEPSMDFDDNGRFKRGRGWFLSLVDERYGRHDSHGGQWFETRERAISALYNYNPKRKD